jgi:hypothetical protein
VAAQPEITSAPAAVSATAAEMRLILTDSSCAGLCAHVRTGPDRGADRENHKHPVWDVQNNSRKRYRALTQSTFDVAI